MRPLPGDQVRLSINAGFFRKSYFFASEEPGEQQRGQSEELPLVSNLDPVWKPTDMLAPSNWLPWRNICSVVNGAFVVPS